VYEQARCCLAIHNLSHQGSFDAHFFHDVGLPGEWYSTLEWETPEEKNRRKTINVLKVGGAVCV
jgi:starch synthase